MTLAPRLDILPPPLRTLWPELAAVPGRFVLYGGTGLALRLGHRQSLDFDFFEDEPEPEASPETRARRAFEAAAGALPETIDASDLFRAWPEGVDERVLIVQRYVRGAVPGWFVYAPAARTEAEAQRLGARLHNALVAPRSLRADQIRLHELPLTVGWPGGTVGVGAER